MTVFVNTPAKRDRAWKRRNRKVRAEQVQRQRRIKRAYR